MSEVSNCLKEAHRAFSGLDIVVGNHGWTRFSDFNDLNAMDEAESLADYKIEIKESNRTNDGKESIDFSMTILASAIRQFAVKTRGLDYSPEHHAVVSAVLSQYIVDLFSTECWE